MSDDNKKSIKAHCNRCGPYISHDILSLTKRPYEDAEAMMRGNDTYYLLECRGCEQITLKHESWVSYSVDENGEPVVKTVYYPPAISRKDPEWLTSVDSPFFWEFDKPIRRLLKEIYSALHNDSQALAAMGIRALIERIMVEKIGDSGAIGANVDKFIDEGYVAPKSEELFRNFLIESGHAAMHRAYFPKANDIAAMLDIAESLIETIYIHPHRAEIEKIPRKESQQTKK